MGSKYEAFVVLLMVLPSCNYEMWQSEFHYKTKRTTEFIFEKGKNVIWHNLLFDVWQIKMSPVNVT